MKRVLITGITGFVGQHLSRYLLQKGKYEIIGTYHTDSSLSRIDDIVKRITVVKIDLNDLKAVSDFILAHPPSYIIHLAAQTSPADSFKEPTETMITNVIAELNILETLRDSKKTDIRVFAVSSSEVYGMIRPSDLPVDEETSFRPTSPYAVSKIAQDYLGLQYHLSYKLDAIRIRPFNTIGPGQSSRFIVSDFAKQIAEIEKGLKEPVIRVGNLKARRDFTDVRDVIRAYELLMENGEAGEVYNIGQGRSRQAQEILDTLLSFAKKEIQVEEDPAKIRPVDLPDVVCDASKLQKLTGWKPEVPFEQTLQDTLDYWRKLV